MAKIKVKRGDEELEIEESEIQDGDVRVTSPEQKKEVTFTAEQQEKFNQALAAEKGKWQKKFDDLNTLYTTLQSDVATKEKAQEDALKAKLATKKKNLDPRTLVAVEKLEKFSIQEALDLITTPEDKTTPITPDGQGEGGEKRVRPNITII